MNLARSPIVSPLLTLSAKFGGDFNQLPCAPSLSRNNNLCSSIVNSKASLKSCCLKNDVTEKTTKGFSVLASDIPWESGSTWSTMAFYIFILHIPLGYGGLSIVAYILHQPVIDPQTQALSLFVFQMLELSGALFLLCRTVKPDYELVNLFKANKLPKERNWLLASALGFGVLTLLIVVTSLVADTLFGAKAATNPMVKRILLSSDISRTAFALVNCIIAPVLEEIIYRGFLLTSIASTMNWQHAIIISSVIFSAAHFSIDNFLQLFMIGCVLGCSYCWSGNLSSSIAVHSLYNTLMLMITFLS